MSERIFKQGVELEGGWPTPIPFNDVVIYRDGSVNIFGGYEGDDGLPFRDGSQASYSAFARAQQERRERLEAEDATARIHMGEIASLPLPRKKTIPWVIDHYPTYTNRTCGMHVHTSFKHRLDIARLMDVKFWDLFGDRMQALANKLGLPRGHHFRTRLSGENDFCHKSFNPLLQYKARGKGSNRYTQLNFCYALHGTIECRLFPTFESKDMAVEAINALSDTYEEFLADNKNKKIKGNLSYTADLKRVKESLRGGPLERLEDQEPEVRRMRSIEGLEVTLGWLSEGGYFTEDDYIDTCSCQNCLNWRRAVTRRRAEEFLAGETATTATSIDFNLDSTEEGGDQ